MHIKFVSVDGPDDTVDPKQLRVLQDRYPFVEWGILLSPKKDGIERYPSRKWVQSLKGLGLNLCAHACGNYVADLLKDGNTPIAKEPYFSLFNRYQLNMTKKRLSKTLLESRCFTILAHFKKQFIFAGDYAEAKYMPGLFRQFDVVPLYDASGGHGVSTDWLPPMKGVLTGYAGGLNADVIVDYLDTMADRLEMIHEENDPPVNIWLGSESGVRDDANQFSLERAEALLQRVELWQAHRVHSYKDVICPPGEQDATHRKLDWNG